jgi:hypothetical protein
VGSPHGAFSPCRPTPPSAPASCDAAAAAAGALAPRLATAGAPAAHPAVASAAAAAPASAAPAPAAAPASAAASALASPPALVLPTGSGSCLAGSARLPPATLPCPCSCSWAAVVLVARSSLSPHFGRAPAPSPVHGEPLLLLPAVPWSFHEEPALQRLPAVPRCWPPASPAGFAPLKGASLLLQLLP